MKGKNLGNLTGHPSQVQPSPQPQDPEVAHPQPFILIVGLGGVEKLEVWFECVWYCGRRLVFGRLGRENTTFEVERMAFYLLCVAHD